MCSYWLHDTKYHEPAAYTLSKITGRTNPDPELSQAASRITGITDPDPEIRQGMPKAKTVTSLLLRRQNRCPWKGEVLEELLDLLPEVRELHYEPWRDWEHIEQVGDRSTIICKPQNMSVYI